MRQTPHITADATGLNLEGMASAHRRAAMAWADVDYIVAFKRDLGIVDCICLSVCSNDRSLNFDEETRGWDEVVDRMPMYLPGCRPFTEWWSDVAFPPFATSETVVFSKATPQ